jgi:hypothetical protein
MEDAFSKNASLFLERDEQIEERYCERLSHSFRFDLPDY